uniref:Methyltransferase type 11 domain-containing protein n=1 Tax=Kalanchoe fedtschenkoi TaxID=63787 RepID=A0A7N0TL27_KALFE
MADLFHNQAQHYAQARPTYPQSLFHFISSKTPSHQFAWDAGAGNGQATKSIAALYANVIATDTSAKQIQFAPSLPNAVFRHTPPSFPVSDLPTHVAPPSTLDLVTVAQALHWFDLPNFYALVNAALKKPHGVIAAWCYTTPHIDAHVDPVFDKFYKVHSAPYWDPQRKLVDDRYASLSFPFEAVDGCDGTGPFEFTAEVEMDLDGFLRYLRSWSAYQTAKEMGVELLSEGVVEEFKKAWIGGGGGDERKVVKFPVYLRIGKVGNEKRE